MKSNKDKLLSPANAIENFIQDYKAFIENHAGDYASHMEAVSYLRQQCAKLGIKGEIEGVLMNMLNRTLSVN